MLEKDLEKWFKFGLYIMIWEISPGLLMNKAS